jgi:hypothetical protein
MPAPTPIARIPVLAGAFSCSCLAGAAAGFFAAGLAQHEPALRLGPSDSAALGTLPVAGGALLSLAVLAPARRRSPAHLGGSAVASVTLRALFVGLGGVALHSFITPNVVAYFAALWTAMVLSALCEFAWAALAIRSARRHPLP